MSLDNMIVNSGDISDVNGELFLVEAIAGLTNYTHTPWTRAPRPQIPNTLIDEMTVRGRSATIDEALIGKVAAHAGSLNQQPGQEAKIRGGYSEFNKGMMKLIFKVKSGGLDDYISVIGYITNNSAEGGISYDAIYTPVISWKHRKTTMGGLDKMMRSIVTNQIGTRTDYLLNDGSDNSIVGLRPSDLIDGASANIGESDFIERMKKEGVIGTKENKTPSNNTVDLTGIVPSKRTNYNPTEYAKEIVEASAMAQQERLNTISGTLAGMEGGTGVDNSTLLANISTEMHNKEPSLRKDIFLRFMKEQTATGGHTWRGFRGWRIKDLGLVFSNFGNVLDTSVLDARKYKVFDHKEVANIFGTSTTVERVAQEINFSMLELMIRYNITGVSLKGSNCDRMADEHELSNIMIQPYNGFSLSNDDMMLAPNMKSLANRLKNQIMAKLNGENSYQLTPIRFTVVSELMGITKVEISMPTTDNREPPTYKYAFPTYCPTPYSPINGSAQEAHFLSESVYAGIKSYFNG